MISKAALHHYILTQIVDLGYGPDLSEIADHFDVSLSTVKKSLLELQEYHGAVLHPHDQSVWIIHPFSLAPTNFSIRAGDRQWWGNCAWCSLGAAALLDRDLSITTTIGAEGQQVEINIKNGIIQESELWIHFPIPMKQAWDNVIFTCSTMLVFESEHQVIDWSKRHKLPKGDVQPIERIWEFSKKWYGNHLDQNWTKWTSQEAKDIFAEFGLDHPVWQLEDSAQRF